MRQAGRKGADEAAPFLAQRRQQRFGNPRFEIDVVVEIEDGIGVGAAEEKIALLRDAMANRPLMPFDLTAACFDCTT